jgi:hypothetical protein
MAGKRVRNAGMMAGHPREAGLVAEMLNEARRHHATGSEAEARVLMACSILRTRKLWTPEMAERVKQAAAMVVIALVVMAGQAWAAKTTVTEATLAGGDGWPAQGSIEIRPWVPFTASDGTRVEGTVTAAVVNGRFSVDLEPGAYRVQIQLEDAAPRSTYWVVLAGGGPVGMCAVEAVRVSGAWVVAGCTGGTLSWHTLTQSQWSAITQQQWAALGQ